jgi:hypothetical protein
MAIGSVLQALIAFPGLPPHEHEDEDDGSRSKATDSRKRADVARYALRTLAVLVETIAQRNALVTPEEFPYWLTQLRALLLEQTAAGDLDAIRALEVDVFDALDKPGFVPPWLTERPELLDQYLAFLGELRAVWCAPMIEEALCA